MRTLTNEVSFRTLRTLRAETGGEVTPLSAVLMAVGLAIVVYVFGVKAAVVAGIGVAILVVAGMLLEAVSKWVENAKRLAESTLSVVLMSVTVISLFAALVMVTRL